MNNKSFLEPCLRAVFQSGIRSSFDVVVVDNGSTDGSQDMLRQEFPRVKLIENRHNNGLSAASNQGMTSTNGRYVLLLNDDTLVNGQSLDALVSFLDSTPVAGAVGGRLLDPDGTFQASFANFSSLRQEFMITTRLGELIWNGYPSHHDSEHARSVDWLSSACLLIRRSALAQVGLLDEDYFIYGDEADLQYRLKRSGWEVYYLPDASTIHYGGRSLDRWRRRKMVYRGKMLFYRKNYGFLHGAALQAMIGLVSVVKLLVWVAAASVPRWRDRAQQELRSNLEVMNLSLALR